MKNTLTDLNNYLFGVLESLTEEDITEERFQKEVARSEAITSVAQTIIQNAELTLKTLKYLTDNGSERVPVPAMLELKP